MTVLAQIPGVPAPPANSPVAFLGWAVAIAMGIAIFVWRLREKERTEQIGGLKTQVTDRDLTIVKLGEKLDRERIESQARVDNLTQRTVVAIARRSSPQQAARGAEQWQELPTGVRDVLDIVAKAMEPAPKHVDPFADLEEWTPTGATSRPPPEPSRPYRGKLPSRHDR
jgi:hypothetical protein